MSFTRSIDVLCGLLASAGSNIITQPELLDNILLHVYFSERDSQSRAGVLGFVHTMNNLATPLFLFKERVRPTIEYIRGKVSPTDYCLIERRMDIMVEELESTGRRIRSVVDSTLSKELSTQYNPQIVKVGDLLGDARELKRTYDQANRTSNVSFTFNQTDSVVFADKYALMPAFADLVKNALDELNNDGQIDVSVSQVNLTDICSLNDLNLLEVLKRRIGPTSINSTAYKAVRVYNSGPHLVQLPNGHYFKPGLTTKKNGHGIGMMSVINNVETSRGFIWCENCFNGSAPAGVAFTVYLPTPDLVEYTSKLPFLYGQVLATVGVSDVKNDPTYLSKDI